MAFVIAVLSQCVVATLASNVKVDIDVAGGTLHPMNPMYMGCHSDSGFVHEVTGWSSQMLFGESFERPPNTTVSGQSSYAWQNVVDDSIADRTTITLDQTNNFSGWPSQNIVVTGGQSLGTAGLANRGLGNEGLYIQKGMPYEGYFFASSDKPVVLEARIETTDGKVLASQQIQTSGGVQFTKYDFNLTPSNGTECVGIAPGSDPTVHCTNNPNTAHVCIKCGGQFTVALVANECFVDMAVNIAYVVMQPGEWGRYKGLNARKDVADTLATMGVKAIRLGGSFCSVTKDDGEYYQWQKWTGPVWNRPSIGAHWDSYGGNSYNLIGGWGPFEMIDYATALGAEPIITTTMTSTPESFADLIDYCWANDSTVMGRKRIQDGHPEQYKLRFIELGNEQYNNNYVDQVVAMEQRAKEVGADNQLHYIFPDNGGVNSGDIAKAAALNLGNRLVTDLHVGAGGALPVAASLFEAHSKGGLTDDAAVNFETNAGTHNHGRALDEAADLNDFFNLGEKRMLARTASFCHGRAGHFDMFDQAISFFMPNMTWLQPPGHVHAMITASWQPNVLNATVTTTSPVTPPIWNTLENKSMTCSASEYKGDAGVTDSAGCLMKAKATLGVDYAVWQGQANKNCYLCNIPGDPSTWKLNDTPGSVVFTGSNIIVPMSVSVQTSTDGNTVVTRVVNNDVAKTVTLNLNGGFTASSATAVSMASSDLDGENTAANVNNVAPLPNGNVKANGASVSIEIDAFSYTIVTINK